MNIPWTFYTEERVLTLTQQIPDVSASRSVPHNGAL